MPSPQLSGLSPERMVLRPDARRVKTLAVVIGIISFIGTIGLLVMGATSATVLTVGMACGWLYLVAGTRLYADSTRVWGNRLLVWGSCPREALGYMLVRYASKGNYVCVFYRKDGSRAFAASYKLFGEPQFQQLAQYLGVPFYADLAQMLQQLK